MKPIPMTIENRWDILYRDYPEIYAEFAAVPKDPPLLPALMQRFDFQNKVVADIGSGSGASAFEFAKVARKVIGVEIEDAMRGLAEREMAMRGLQNVEFVKGDARSIPLQDDSVELVTGITLPVYPVEGHREFVKEAERIITDGGRILMINITPGWYGGELSDIILEQENYDFKQNEILVEELGFLYEDFETNQEYGSLDKILRTYGFIFGRNAIEYLKKNNKTNIQWKFRVHHKEVRK
jgi:ubiquinone/menaquinone biosynthesis C-methylase UbiE